MCVCIYGRPRWCGGKESACQCRGHKRYQFCSWVGKIPWRRKWQPTQYSCLENPMDRAWRTTVHRVAKRQTRLSCWTHICVYTYTYILRNSLQRIGFCDHGSWLSKFKIIGLIKTLYAWPSGRQFTERVNLRFKWELLSTGRTFFLREPSAFLLRPFRWIV